jgi:hypothetical protein
MKKFMCGILAQLFKKKERVLPKPGKHIRIMLKNNQVMYACQAYQRDASCTPEQALQVITSQKGE